MRSFSIFSFLFLQVMAIAQNTDSLLNLAKSTKDNEELAGIYYQLAIKYQQLNLDSANLYAIKMGYHASKTENKELQFKNFLALGNIYSDMGSSDGAIDNYIKALAIAESYTGTDTSAIKQVKARKIILANNIGISYFRNGDLEKSKESFLNTLEMLNNSEGVQSTEKTQSDKASVMNNLASIYMGQEKFDVALEYLLNSASISNKDSKNLTSIYNNIGISYLETGEYEKSFHYLTLAKERAELLKENYLLVSVYNNIANYYLRRKQYDFAKVFLDKCSSLERQINLPHSRNLTQKYYSELYLAQGKPVLAYQKLIEHQQLHDSLINQASTIKIAQVEKQYELDKAQREYLVLQEQLKEKQRRRLLIMGIIMVVALSAGLIILLLFVLQRTKLKKTELESRNFALQNEKLEQELDFKNKELATNVMYMVRKNELLNTISEKLLRLKLDLKKSNQQPLQQIIMELQQGMDNEIWKEFEVRFMEVHKDFYDKLGEMFPDLSPNERKLCAFLKLNMSTKEISAITFQSPESIRIARTRLRKKLNLTHSDQNLVEFLENL